MMTRTARLTTVLSYPDRGPWGDPTYRGNCSGHVVRDLLAYYRPRHVLDPMEGGGTTRDVCAELGIDYAGTDLRNGAGLDLYSRAFTDWLTEIPPIDFIFWHPPYGGMIRYSDHPRDLSTVPVERFCELLQLGAQRLWLTLAPGGHLAILIGIWRHQGRVWDFHRELVAWREPTEPVMIKVQHNCDSDRTDYRRARFIPILHENLLVWRKPAGGLSGG